MRKRLLSLLIPTVVLAVLVHEIFTTPVYTDREISAMREAAVGRFQQGEVDEALEQLRALTVVAPEDRLAWGDYLTLLTRAGRASEAIALAQAEPERSLPDYALAELFAAAVAAGQWDVARHFADREIAQSPNAAIVAAARQQALAAAMSAAVAEGEGTEPEQEIATPAPEVSAPIAEATVAATPPLKPAVRRQAAVSPPRPGTAPDRAPQFEVRPEPPSVATAAPTPEPPAPQLSLGEQARDAVRAAEQAAPAQRVALARQAAALTSRHWREQLADPQASARDRRNAALDHVRALTLARELDEAAIVFDSLDVETLPRYGVLHGADLYALRREPERAAALLDRAEQLEPGAGDILASRFYNQLDLEQYDAAQRTLEQLRASAQTPAEQRDARLLAAMFAAYDNRLDDAQQALEQLQLENPSDSGIALRRAQIYRWRGWAERSQATYAEVLPVAEDPVGVRAGMVATALSANDLRGARQQLAQLQAEAPEHPEVVEVAREAGRRNLASYRARVIAGDTHAESSLSGVNGDSDLGFEQYFHSAPIADSYRFLASHRYDWADLPEGAGSATRISVGGDYRSQSLDAAVELTGREPDSQPGLRLRGEWRPDDAWSLYGEFESDSSGVPLRALRQGIDGHSVALSVRHRASESRDTRIGIGRVDFSDDNERDTLSAAHREALYLSAHHELSVTAQAWYSRNSAGSNVPYFNPESDLSIGATFEYVGILSRRFERGWSHRLAVGVAGYEQEHFDASTIWDVEYEHRLRLSPLFSINGGVLYRSRIYDGEREGYSALFAGIEWNF